MQRDGRIYAKNRGLATISTLLKLGKSKEEAIQFASEQYAVTVEYVKELMTPKTA